MASQCQVGWVYAGTAEHSNLNQSVSSASVSAAESLNLSMMIRVIVLTGHEFDRSYFNQTFNQVKRDTVTLILAATTIHASWQEKPEDTTRTHCQPEVWKDRTATARPSQPGQAKARQGTTGDRTGRDGTGRPGISD